MIAPLFGFVMSSRLHKGTDSFSSFVLLAAYGCVCIGLLSSVLFSQQFGTKGPDNSKVCSAVGLSQRVATILYNGSIWTGEHLQGERYVSAMALLEDGRVGCTGSSRQVLGLAQRKTEVMDLMGRSVIPGLIDTHVHLLKGATSLSSINFSAVTSIASFKEAVRQACVRTPRGKWLYAVGWDESVWGGQPPNKQWLDEACPEKPVYLNRMCGHKGVVNSRGAAVAGLTKDTLDPEGGKIYRQEGNSDFTGLLAENAMALVTEKMPDMTLEDKRAYVAQAAEYLLSQGVTMVHDMGDCPTNEAEAFENLDHLYQDLATAGSLPIRLFAFVPLASGSRMAAYVKANGTAHPSGRLFWGGLKEFADGSLGSGTALMRAPYTDDPSTSGIRTLSPAHLERMIQAADASGLQVAVHAIGDLAVDEVLGIYQRVASRNDETRTGPKPRHRIEHAQHLSGPETAAGIAASGVHVVANPLHLLPDKRILRSRLGEQRSRRSYALRTVHEAGAQLSFASDWPVVRAEPLSGLYAAAFRRAPTEVDEPFVPEEAVSLEQALRASTITAAALAGLEEQLGSLKAGKLADFVVLTRDPLKMTASTPLPQVLQTYVSGVCAYGCTADGSMPLRDCVAK